MPTPHPATETQEAWMNRCIPFVLNDGTASNQTQAVAICISMWEDATKPKPKPKEASMATKLNKQPVSMPMQPHPSESMQQFMDRCMADGSNDQEDCQAMWDGNAMGQGACGDGEDPAGMMGRAYSFLTIKSVNEDQRIIEGIASTPTPDRIGDIVNPMGAKFNLPMPLLWQHRADQPIGNVISATATETGIAFKAKIAKSLEAGTLKERLDEAWQSIKLGLVRAVSIGFAPLKFDFIKGGGGIEFKEWEWLELSAVTIPANTEANISVIRSIDSELRAKAASWSCGAARDLPLNTTAAWDGAAAQASMFAAGMATARRGHLAYDSSAPDLKGSYKLPFARVSSGNLEALASGIRAAASRLPQTDIPASVVASARAVLDHYESRMKPGDSGKTANSPGASGLRKPVKAKENTVAKLNIAEQVSAFEATLTSKVERRDEIMRASCEKGETLADPDKQEYDTLETEITDLNEHIDRLRKLQTSNAQKAVPVEGNNPKDASKSRGGQVISVKPNYPKGIGMARIVIARMHAYKNNQDAAQVAERMWPSNPEIAMAIKTAVAPGDSTTSGWASQLAPYQILATEFIEYLRPMTLVGRIPGFRMVPFNVAIPKQTAGTSGHWVAEGLSKPVGKLTFDTVNLRWAKCAGIVAFTEEIARFSNPAIEALVRDDLARGLQQFLDEQLLDPSVTEVTNVSPASITNGADNHAASGTTYADLVSDIKGAFAVLQAVNIPVSGSVWIMEPQQAVALAMMQNPLGQPQFPSINVDGGTLLGLPVYVSESAGSGQITLFKPGECLLADDGGFAIDISREATLHMDDTATDSSSLDHINLWQNNLVGVRCERYINWKMRRDDAVVYLTACDYGGPATTI